MPLSFTALQPYFSEGASHSFTQIPSAYEDSSHTIFLQDTAQQKEVIKALNVGSAYDSDFWQGMAHFFGVNLKQQLQCFDSLYPLIARGSSLKIPTLLQTVVVPSKDIWAIKTDFLSGQSVLAEQVTSQMVRQLAKHLAKLHQIRSTRFGYVVDGEENQRDWPKHLNQQLSEVLSVRPLLKPSEKEKLLSQIDAGFQPDTFGVIMPDLRWDQFLQLEGSLTALTDLDALVFGPIELDWVLLEYLLMPEHAEIFRVEYERHRGVPKIAHVRSVYRTLLFCMNVLGEKNYQAWCDHPALFD